MGKIAKSRSRTISASAENDKPIEVAAPIVPQDLVDFAIRVASADPDNPVNAKIAVELRGLANLLAGGK